MKYLPVHCRSVLVLLSHEEAQRLFFCLSMPANITNMTSALFPIRIQEGKNNKINELELTLEDWRFLQEKIENC
jgi:hypothetical protein